MSSSRPRSRSRKQVAAVSVAGFVAILGYQAARMHAGGDPALARANQKAAKTQSGSQSTTQRQDSAAGDGNGYGYDDGSGQSSSGQGSGAQNYYTPSQSDTPTTRSS
jgi:hypothetical protein